MPIFDFIRKFFGWLTKEEKKLLPIVEDVVNIIKEINTSSFVTGILDIIVTPEVAGEWQQKIKDAADQFLSALATITPCINTDTPKDQLLCIINLIQASQGINRRTLLSSLAAHIYSSVTTQSYSHSITLTQAQYNKELPEEELIQERP